MFSYYNSKSLPYNSCSIRSSFTFYPNFKYLVDSFSFSSSGCFYHPDVARLHRQRRLPVRHEGVPDQVFVQEHRDAGPVGLSGGGQQETRRKDHDDLVRNEFS